MKIIYCIPAVHNSGGMERVLSMKANYLADEKGWDISIITTEQHGKEPYYSFSPKIKFYDLDINYNELMSLSMIDRIRGTISKKTKHRKALEELLIKLKADIVVSMFTHEASFLYKIKDGSKKVLEIHFSKYFRQLDDESNHASLIKRMMSRCLNWRDFSKIKYYDKFVVLTKRDLNNWGKKGNITYIHNPINVIPELKANLHSKRVIAVGRHCAQKGFDLLIGIWAEVKKNDAAKDWTLDIYGSGPDTEILIEHIKNLNVEDSITLKAPVKDIFSEYAKSSIFCLSSRYEGFAMTLSEAMSCGLPSIAFDCPCGPSELIDNEKNGFIVPAFDCNEYKNRLIELMMNSLLLERFSMDAKNAAKKKFFIHCIMDKWIKLFEEII